MNCNEDNFRPGGTTAVVNGTTLYYEVSGEGDPILLLHGNGEDCSVFDEVAVLLRKSYRLYAIDSRNHGRSKRTEDYSYETMTEDAAALIRTLALEKVRILGFSDGAIVGLMLAMRHGDLVSKAALLGINLKPSDFTDENMKFIQDAYQETGDPLFKMMMEQPNIELDDVRNLAVPVLLVCAEDDLFKPESFEILAQAIPRATQLVMKGHDHASYIIHNDLIGQDLFDFFGADETGAYPGCLF